MHFGSTYEDDSLFVLVFHVTSYTIFSLPCSPAAIIDLITTGNHLSFHFASHDSPTKKSNELQDELLEEEEEIDILPSILFNDDDKSAEEEEDDDADEEDEEDDEERDTVVVKLMSVGTKQ